MKTKKFEKTKEKEHTLLENKEHKKFANGRVPVQQGEIYRKPTENVIEEAVKELNPDMGSMESRG